MGATISAPMDFVKRSGDTMSGNLAFTGAQTVDGVDVSALAAIVAGLPSPIWKTRIKTGTYTGNGADNRDINIGVNLAAKNNVYLIIKAEDANYATHRIEYAQGDLGMIFISEADAANRVQSFTATGFQIGDSTMVNSNLIVYRWIAFWEEP